MKKTCPLSVRARRREREREETSHARVRSPIDAGQSQGGGGRGWGGARARRSSKWKNKEGGGGEGGLAVRSFFKMYVAYGWPKLLSISAGSSKDNIVHLFVLQDWLLLVSSSRVQIWNASQVSGWVSSWLHVVCARSIIRSHWSLLWGTCFGIVHFGVCGSGFRVFSLALFFFGLLIGTHHREGRGVWGVGNKILRSDLDSTPATLWKKWAGPFVTIGVLLSDFVNIWIWFESGFFLGNWYLFQADLLVCNVCCASDSLFSSGWSDYLCKGIISYGGWF